MIGSLLIANRGEIACRVIRTARALGVRTVVVYSDADAEALHVHLADEAVNIGPAPAAESYLRGEAIIAAAKTSGAEAVHPGYGFLSESADFAQAVTDAGLVWVGPSPASIRAMGLKDAAKRLMRAAGVTVTPGYDEQDQSLERLAEEAEAIGWPVLIKAVAGGGGKGMRKVDAAADFAAALASCQREASASFGNSQVLLEKWIANPRHIEVQVFGDAHGNVVHLFERDCSLQRRHQKVIEEAPAPGMDAATREAICVAAVRAARAVDYVGAGTVEFIADASAGLSADAMWFMEMNTRLQVEHPITEAITGVDLVEWQLRVASGEPLPLRQDELAIRGHAIEARLYAEDPATGFLPSTGRLEVMQFGGEGRCRIDTGVGEGSAINPFYDPMIAKIISHAADRDRAIITLREACDTTAVWPVKSNAWFLDRLLGLDEFVAGTMTTGLIEEKLASLTAPPELSAAALHQCAIRLSGTTAMQGFRLNAPSQTVVRLLVDDREVAVDLSEQPEAHWPAHLSQPADGLWVENGAVFTVGTWRYLPDARAVAGTGTVVAPMPGSVTAVEVTEGDQVAAGQRLLTLEAMKMEYTLTAPFAGVVKQLCVAPGAQVQLDALLARIEPEEG